MSTPKISTDQNTLQIDSKTYQFTVLNQPTDSACDLCSFCNLDECEDAPCLQKERIDGRSGFFKLENIPDKKGIIFVGLPESGKSHKAFEIAKKYKSVIINARKQNFTTNPFVFQMAEKDTELIVIDDLTSIRSIECFFSAINHNPDSGLVVNKKGESKCIIKPLILITLCSDISINEIPNGCSFRDRFDIYEFPYDGEIEFKPL